MPTNRDIALVRAGLEAAAIWFENRYPFSDAIEILRSLDPAAIAAGVPNMPNSGCACTVSDDGETILDWCYVHAATRRDAERYRWLRYRAMSEEMPRCSGIALDRAIDAAMEERK